MWIVIGCAAILCCVIMEGFFSGSEIAIISSDKIKLRHLVSLGSKGATLAQKMLQQPERFLGTTLVGTNFCLVTSSVILTNVVASLFPELSESIELYVTMVLTPLVLVFGEIVPKSVYQQHADRLVPIIAIPLHVAFRLFYPVVFIVSTIGGGILKLLGVEKRQRKQTLTREELKFLLHSDGGVIADRQRTDMIQRVFEFGGTTVEEILVPLTDVYALEKGTTIESAIEIIHECGFSRLPIYEGRVDHFVGVIHAFDLLRAPSQDALIDRFIRKAYYVPNTMQLADLVRNLQRHHTQIAIVVNEYGGVLGIVTLEDSLEQIVGEIDDEFDVLNDENYQQLPDGSYRIHAHMKIDSLTKRLPLKLPNGNSAFETLGGFLLSEFRRIPASGESLEYGGLTFQIEEATDRSILWVRVTPKSVAEPSA